MARKTPVQLVGGAYSDDALPWTAQDCVNYIPVFAEKEGTRSPKMLRGAPGCSLYCASMTEAPIRGTYDCEGLFLAVAGNTLYRIASTGLATSIGTIPGTERVTFAHNQVTGGHQVAIGNGQSGYVYVTSDSSFAQITDDGFPGFRSVDFIDQFIIGVEPFGRFWFHSDLSDATAYNTLDRYTAEKAPDLIQQVIATGSDVFALGQRKSQFFYNTGATTGTFANRPGTEMDIGAASPWTACRLDNTVYWLGHDGTVYRLEGNQPRRVSTHALEQAFSRADTSQAYAYTFEDRGHKIYYLTVGGRTWGFDVATGEWHRRKSFGLDFWRFSSLTRHRGRWFGGDYTNGKLYLLDWAIQDEDGAELERSRISPVLHDDQNRIIVNLLELVFDTGMDARTPPLPVPLLNLSITGDVPDGTVGEALTGTYTATGGTTPYASYTVTAGSLPTGLALDATTGVVTGVPTTGGTYNWTVTVTDANGDTASVNDTADIAAFAFLTAPDATITDGVYLSLTGTSWGSHVDSGLVAAVSALLSANDRVFVFANGVANGRTSADRGAVWADATGFSTMAKASAVYAEHEGIGRYLVFMGGGASAYSSTNGTAFSAITVESRSYYGAAAIGSTVVVMSTSASLILSADGGQSFSEAFSNGIGQVELVAASETAFVALGDGLIIRSTTGASGSWSQVAAPAGTAAGLAYGNGRFVALMNDGTTHYSVDDGLTWAEGGTLASFIGGAGDYNLLAYGNGLFVAVGSVQEIHTSPTAVTWTERQTSADPPNFIGIVNVRYVP